jgi:hypothetical protein
MKRGRYSDLLLVHKNLHNSERHPSALCYVGFSIVCVHCLCLRFSTADTEACHCALYWARLTLGSEDWLCVKVARKHTEWQSNLIPSPKLHSSSCELNCISYFSNFLCCRQLQSLEHSVASDMRLILTILQQQHPVHSSESSGSSMMPDYREVRSETPLPLVTPFISLSESLICYAKWLLWNSVLGSTPRKYLFPFLLSCNSSCK